MIFMVFTRSYHTVLGKIWKFETKTVKMERTIQKDRDFHDRDNKSFLIYGYQQNVWS